MANDPEASREPASHGSGHAPDVHAADPVARRRLALALLIAVAVAAFEFWGSLITGSLALLADAGHVIADAGALTLALAAVYVAGRPHSTRWTFGYHRAEVLAASVNGLTLLLIAAFIVWRAVDRLRSPSEVEGGGLIVIAAIGLLANAVAWWILKGPSSVNVRAARLHVLSDLAGSVVAVFAGAVVLTTGWERADSLLSLAIVGLIVLGALRLLHETFGILMAGVPPGIDLAEIDAELRALPGVASSHDMHCWTITTGFVAFACHLQLAPGADAHEVVEEASSLLRSRFGIEHVTIQPDPTLLLDPLAERHDTPS